MDVRMSQECVFQLMEKFLMYPTEFQTLQTSKTQFFEKESFNLCAPAESGRSMK